MAVEETKKRKRKKWRTLTVFLVLFAIDQVWVQWNRRITLGHDTTRITSPIVDGYPDYLAAMNQKRRESVTTENNAAPRITAIVGMADGPDAWRKAVYTEWGVGEPAPRPVFRWYSDWVPKPATTVSATADATISNTSPEDPLDVEADDAMKGPWSAAEHPQLARWLREMDPVFAALDEASTMPRYYFPLLLADGGTTSKEPFPAPLVPELGGVRAITRSAVLRAMLRLHEGDTAGLEHDLLLCMRTSRLLAQQPSYIEHLVALGIDTLALETAQRAAAGPLDAAAAAHLRGEIEALLPMPTPTRAIDENERYLALNSTLMFRKASDKYWGFALYPTNYDAALRRVNGIYDRSIQVFALPTSPQRRDAFALLQKEVDVQFQDAGKWHQLTHMENFMLGIVYPSVARSEGQQMLNFVKRDLALAALALRQAKARDGAFPDSLGVLNVPGFVVPPDRFIEKPLVYARKGAGYVLYSVGVDLEDNGGTPQPDFRSASKIVPVGSTAPRKWDLVVEVVK